MIDAQGMMEEYHCSSCGAKLFTDKTTIITRCVYCNGQQILKQAYASNFAPKKILPFRITKEEFINICYDHLAKNKYVANEIKNNPIFQDVKGLYVPYYSANYDVRVYADGMATTGGEDASYKKFTIDFSEKALASIDASVRLDDSMMESLKPYDYADLKDFNPMYLAGFQGELPSDSIERIETNLERRLLKYCYNCVSQDMPYRYHSSGQEIYDFNRTTEFECALLPVWFVSTEYQGSRFTFLVNGQTGKIIGDIPISKSKNKKRKFYKYSLISSIAIAIISLIVTLFGAIVAQEFISDHVEKVIVAVGGILLNIFIWIAVLFGFLLVKFDKEIIKLRGIEHLYNIPITTWNKVYHVFNPVIKEKRKDLRSTNYYSSAVTFKRYKNGVYISDVDTYSLEKYSKSSKKANFTKNNNNL